MIDDKDLELLSILETYSRTPWRRIAHLMGLSEATIYLRVKKLVTTGVIEGFGVKIKPDKLGLRAVMFVLIKCEAGKLRRLKKELAGKPYILELHEVTGDYHLLAKIAAPTHDKAAEIVDEIASMKGVVGISTIMSLSSIKTSASFVDALRYWRARGHT